MDYELTPDGQIQADFARRAGVALLQYENSTQDLPPDVRYEATLTICVLQSLIVTCHELIKRKLFGRQASDQFAVRLPDRPVTDAPALMGLDQECSIKCWPIEGSPKYRHLIAGIRHALSHPLAQNTGSTHRTTGYTSLKGEGGVIKGFSFVQSPWVNSTGSDLLPAYKPKLSERSDLLKIVERWRSDYGDSRLEIVEENGRCVVHREKEPFVPVLQIDMTVTQLRTFTLILCELLAAPLKDPHAQPSSRRVPA